jgi:peroxiredoxin
MSDALPAGAQAPDFRLQSTGGEVSLSHLLSQGHRVVVAFYSEDATPSCQTEIEVLKDAHELLREFGAEVIAISADTLESHRTFAARLGGVPFPLAVDDELKAAQTYGVVDAGDRRRSGRAVFVIERDGRVILTLAPYQPGNLAGIEAILNVLGREN